MKSTTSSKEAPDRYALGRTTAYCCSELKISETLGVGGFGGSGIDGGRSAGCEESGSGTALKPSMGGRSSRDLGRRCTDSLIACGTDTWKKRVSIRRRHRLGAGNQLEYENTDLDMEVDKSRGKMRKHK